MIITSTAPDASRMARSPLSLDTLLKMNDRSESNSMERREVSSVLVCLQPHPVNSTSRGSSDSLPSYASTD